MVGEEWLRQLDVLLVNAHESLPDDEIINRAIAMTHRALTASPQVQGGEAWKIGVFDRWNAYATELGFAGLVDALKWINDQRAAPQRAPGVDDTHAFKNFHRLLCERFDYAHDDIDWRRDQVSLIEHVARKVAAPVSAVGVDGVTYQSRAISDRSLKDSGWMQIPADGFMRYPTLFDYRALAAAPTPQGQGEGNA